MDERFLIDTNVAIYVLEGMLPDQSLPFMRIVLAADVHLSVISQIELLGWQAANTTQAMMTEAFVSRAVVYPLDEAVVQQTITLRKQVRIKLPDAIIAATALVYELTLVSRNDKDFMHVPGLSYRNPFR